MRLGTLSAWIVWVLLILPPTLLAQTKPLRELNVAYPFGGSTSYFWVAQRSGSFEKYGLRVEPIYIRGGVAGVQALLAKNVLIEMQGASAVVSAWAQGAKDLKYIGAVG